MSQNDFHDFVEWLFPGEEPPTPNAASIPTEAREILKLVEGATGVPWNYLEKAARLVLDGLAGLRCLWFLHGLEGEIEEPPEELEGTLRQQIDYIVRNAQDKANAKAAGTGKVVSYAFDWGEGVVTERTVQEYIPRSDFDPLKAIMDEYPDDVLPPPRKRIIKLGKFLHQHGASPALLHAFETRQPTRWGWRISTHPYDVLTMSFKRAWTSCMRPGGVAELGPLTDMAAGSAILFYYRPGAMEPCGRVVLRPYISGDDGHIACGGGMYGNGPQTVPVDAIRNAMSAHAGVDVFINERERICLCGEKGAALTRYIYSDTDHSHCAQSDEQYEEAYENLGSVEWPEAQLDLGELAGRAAKAAPSIKSISRSVLAQAAISIAEAWVDADRRTVNSIESTMAARKSGNIPTLEDLRASDLPEDNETLAIVSHMMGERLDEMLAERLAEVDTCVLVIYPPEDDEGLAERDIKSAAKYVRGERREVDDFSGLTPGPTLSDLGRFAGSYRQKLDLSTAWLVVLWPDDDLGENHERAVEALYQEIEYAHVNSVSFKIPSYDWSNFD